MIAGFFGGVWRSLSGAGLIIGALFFAASLTPSLIPRGPELQGVLGGATFAAGYGIGVFLDWLWGYLELPRGRAELRRTIVGVAALIAAAIVGYYLWHSAEWQDSIRLAMGMEPVRTAHPFTVGAIAVAVAAVLLVLARLVVGFVGFVANRPSKLVSRRIVRLVAGLAAVAFLVSLANGLLLSRAIRAADASFAALDALIEPDTSRPVDPLMTGSEASLIAWEDLGRRGREFVSTATDADEIEDITGRPAMRPIRVFAGLTSAETPEERARLALDELIRAGGFERSVLIVAAPTGTGWMDPAAMEPLEILHGGDVATVAVQYSYLSSWISLLIEPGYGVEGAHQTFEAVYQYWRELPPETRPRLYLYGLSLGAHSSEQSFNLLRIAGEPFDGALWVGPPYSTPMWRQLTAERNPGSPAIAPVIGDGSTVRFATQYIPPEGAAEWGPLRIAYLQYASDPVVRFEWESWIHAPDWLKEPRGPDVSPDMRWFPVVTFLQLALDNAIALHVPMGFGHLYAPEHHVDAWIEVTQPEGWTPDAVADLKALLAAR